MVEILEGDEPGGLQLKGELELFVRLGFVVGVLGGEIGLAELLHEAKRGVAQGFVGDLYEGNERAAAMGYNGGLISVAAATYPLVGGTLALAGWRYPFILPLLAVPSALAIAFWLKNPEPHNSGGFIVYLQNVTSGSIACWYILGRYDFMCHKCSGIVFSGDCC